MKRQWILPMLAMIVVVMALTPLTTFAATAQVKHTAAPNIGVGSCAHTDYLQIWYNNGGSEVCYSGNGYTGANLRNVGKFIAGNNCGWFLMYSSALLNGSEFITFDSGLAGIDNFSFIPNNLITQIKIKGQNCTGTYP